VFQFADPARFLSVPAVQLGGDPARADEDGSAVTTESIDFAAVRGLASPSRAEATRRVQRALRAAGITLAGASRHASRSFLDAFTVDGVPWLHKAVSTQVSYAFVTPNGLPLEGPGATADFAFDGSGRTSFASVAVRGLSPGPDVPILSQAEALAQCAAGAAPGSALSADLVYYAPPLSVPATAILPHYRCGGEGAAGSGDVTRLKTRYLPATLPGDPFGPPAVAVNAMAFGSFVQAEALISGGTPPFTYAWSSANTPLSTDGPVAAYDVTSRDPLTDSETVHVTVIDGNGLSSSAGATVGVSMVGPGIVLGPDPSSRRVGIEYQSWSAGLSGSEWTAKGFQMGAAAASPAVSLGFLAAELMSWETDFRTNTMPGGRDDVWVDNVDMVYYTAHGFPGGFTFTSHRDFTWITASAMRLGDADLEWLALDTCLVLNNDDGQVVSRVKPMFNGLHIAVGFHTVAADSYDLGGIFTDYMFGTATNPNSRSYGAHMTVVQAWALAAILTNGPDHVWAAMGPYGDGGVSDISDRFWGFGATGPDIRGAGIKGYWRLSGGT
jgi:hypothetical protein